ncbi:Adenylyl cyclase class-3/4/guanylyl cyclase [Trypanosoma melophagium]|uniref:Adenylyl cyclase class-3/4/guanylyl cyclase n=1 Tax=Trypanosoma melophagium TaxID=715481 RepID=UPI00351A5097|nr:Adenylyl cyclase class-3/4/guanylyl cyclase [Trypanosoma melophagium]
MNREGYHQERKTERSAEDSPPRGLRIDIPKSPTVDSVDRCTQGPFDKVEREGENYLNVECKIGGVGASPLSTADLGRQMAATEASNKISSRALLSSHGLRFLSNVMQLEARRSDTCSEDQPKELGSLFGLSRDYPLQAISGQNFNSVPLERNNNNKASHLAAKSTPEDSLCTPMSPGGIHGEDSSDPSTITLKEMLRDASQAHGIQLKWLLCSIILVVIVIFLLLLGQVQILAKNNIVTSEQEVVVMSAAAAVNQLEWLQHSIKNLIRLFFSTEGVYMSLYKNIIVSQLCANIGGAPLVFASYNEFNASLLWSYACPAATLTNVEPPKTLNIDHEQIPGTLRMAVYRSNFIIAMLSPGDAGKIFVVILQKEPVGRLLLANSIPSYSSSALKHSSTSLMLPEYSSSLLVVALHSLNNDFKNYSVTQPTILGQKLHEMFNTICSNGEAYTWHIVRKPIWNESFLREKETIYSENKMPYPYIEYKGVWGGVSRVSVCGILCTDSFSNHCSPTNPTSMRFVVDDLALIRDTEVALTAVGIVSVVAIMLFLTIIITAYVSISVPIQHLNSLIFDAVGGKRTKTRRDHLIFQYTRRCWLGDLQALVRTFQVLLFCFQLNKKYVPQHILEQQMIELQNHKDFLCHVIVENMDLEEAEEEDEDDPSENNQVGIEAFVNTVSAVDPKHGVNMLSVLDAFSWPSVSRSRRESNISGYHALECDVGETGSNLGMTYNVDLVGHGMTIVEGGTILAVHLCAIEMAYFTNYGVAAKQHRRIMNLLLGRIRHYRGELFERSGDCIAATWNAFESCADHAERAALCALSISKLLSQYRRAGFRLGIVLHQGSFVCGVVQDNKAAFTTVFGTVPRQAIALAELAASLPCFNVLVSEPVKQTLSSLYECIMVDVIKYHEDDTPIVMFEISEERRLPPVIGTPLSPSVFAEEHARVFFDFRNHYFERALLRIDQLRLRFPDTGVRLLRRIELLCKYYMQHKSELPLPYFRLYPTWPNYEAIASVDAPSEMFVQGSKEDLCVDNARVLRPPKSIYEDDTARFRQELYDNVLASKRIHNAGNNVKALDGNALKSGRTSRRETPSLAASPSNAIPDQLVLPRSCTAVGRSDPTTPEKKGESSRRVVASMESSSCKKENILNEIKSDIEEGAIVIGKTMEKSSDVLDSLPSVQTKTETVGTIDSETGSRSGRQRFSFTNRLASAVFGRCNRSFFGGTNSLASLSSEAAANIASISVCDVDGNLPGVAYELPSEFVAKNGITYLRSSRILGKGSFGCVYLGMDVHSGRMVAIKFLPLPSEEEEVTNVETEVVTMQKVKSSHVVEFISYAFQFNLIIIVMECMMAGSLQGMISAFTSIPAATARLFIRDVLRGLHKLHSMGVIHRDVKPQNVLLTLAGNCKISDFGASAFLQELVRKQMEGNGLQVQGTPVYLAPEAARGTPEEKSDIWSCGIMFIQLVTGELPYAKPFLTMPPQVLVFQIGSGAAVPIVPDDLDVFDAEFVRHCLQVDPKERLSAKQLLELPLFSL